MRGRTPGLSTAAFWVGGVVWWVIAGGALAVFISGGVLIASVFIGCSPDPPAMREKLRGLSLSAYCYSFCTGSMILRSLRR